MLRSVARKMLQFIEGWASVECLIHLILPELWTVLGDRNNTIHYFNLHLSIVVIVQWEDPGPGGTAAQCGAGAQETDGQTRWGFVGEGRFNKTWNSSINEGLKMCFVFEQIIWKQAGTAREKRSWWPNWWRSSTTGTPSWMVWTRTDSGVFDRVFCCWQPDSRQEYKYFSLKWIWDWDSQM